MSGFEMILPFLKPIEHLLLDDLLGCTAESKLIALFVGTKKCL